MDDMTKIILAIIAAIVGAGLVLTVTFKVIKSKSKKSVRLRQGGITTSAITNTATIDQSDKK
jgi:hypothetical protein